MKQTTERRWGRWGPADERGAANLLTPDRVRDAVGTVQTGEVVSLGLPLDARTLVPPGRSPMQHAMTRDAGDYAIGGKLLGRSRFSDDLVILGTHTGTHVDALAHVWYGEELYNGFDQASVRSTGARRCGIDKLGPLVGRGIMIDVAEHVGLRCLPVDFGVDGEILAAACADASLEPSPGDIALVRTGWLGAHGADPEGYFAGEPGVTVDGAAWLAERDVAAIGCDNYAVERLGDGSPGGFPVHELLLRDRGIPLIEGVVLDELSKRRAREFLFVATPLPLTGGTASPVAPIAVL